MASISKPNQKIDSLFNAIHLPHVHFDKQNSFLRQLDYKVTHVALSILQKTAFAVGAVVAASAAILTGFGSIPFAFVGGCLAVSMICSWISHRMRGYFNPEKLQEHQKQAENLVLSYQYFSEVAAFEDKSTQAKFINPLSVLIKQHTLDDLLDYKIVSPKLLEQAFTLEIEHQEFAKSLELFMQLFDAINKKTSRQEYQGFFDNVNRVMQVKAESFKEQLAAIELRSLDKFSDFKHFQDSICPQLHTLLQAAKLGFVKQDSITNAATQLQEQIQQCAYEVSSNRSFKPILKILKQHKQVDLDMAKLFKGHELHNTIEQKQKEFIDSLALIYINKHERDQRILEEYNENTKPIYGRANVPCEVPEDFLPGDYELWMHFNKIWTEKMAKSLELARLEMGRLVERFAGDDVIEITKSLKQDKEAIDEAQTKAHQDLEQQLLSHKDIDHSFAVLKNARILQIQQAFADFKEAFE